ncbi:cell division protein FtsX [Serpentinicella alkaliphila]|uniref:Cell division protein FtsX n=2 Tax=Serpentinicella alkaliphila TaxID=1734049 RepID=A0A4R2TRX4_9FIRM|nr:cell division protein FtsX [Serpentinicella alkaliphila]
MIMKIKTFRYMFKQGIIGIWRNRGMSLASVTTVAASLMILGVIITLVLNINGVAFMLQNQFDTIQVYLEDEIPVEQITSIGVEIGKIEGIANIEFVSKEQALQTFKNGWGEQGYLLESLESNPLPNSYVIHLEKIENADMVVSELSKLSGIDEVKYYKDIIDNLLRIAQYIRRFGWALISILIVIAMFIISNTIKLTLNARRQEVNIMKYVGATNWFIRWPFIIEGIILGFIGALVSTVIINFTYQSAFELITTRVYVILSSYMILPTDMLPRVIVMFTVIGCGVGALGSIISLRKHLKV